MIEADCSLEYVLLIYALFITCVGIITLTVCVVFHYRALSFVHSTIIQHVE